MKARIKVDFKPVHGMLDQLRKEFKRGKNGARAGFLKDDRRKEGISEEVVALANEFGVPEKNIPSRPFLRNAQKVLNKRLVKLVQADMDDERSLEEIVARCAEEMRNQIIESIDSNIPPPNKESTLKRKKSTHTLIDTGQLRSSVHCSYIVDNKEKLKD